MYQDMMDTIGFIEGTDPALGAAMQQELQRQRRNLELIASENIVSPAVMAAMGSILTNKYAEGYPGKRYYGGCQFVDVVEDIARQRACQLFGAEHANVLVDMAHIAGLVAGGMHQSPVPYADVVTTTTHKTLRGPRGGMILCKEPYAKAIDKAIFPGTQGGPLMHVIAGKAVCLGEALKPSFKVYAENIVKNAQALANGLQRRGVKLVSGGTDNHLMLVDLTGLELTGKELERRLDEVNITANKNTVPGEQRSPFVTSGVRLGTPAVTTRGLKEEDMDVVAECIAMAMEPDFEEKAGEIRSKVHGICEKYPLYE